MERIKYIGLCSAVVVCLCFAVWALISMGVFLHADSECAKYGFPKGEADYKFNTYCVVEYGATEIMIPLKDVKEGKSPVILDWRKAR